MNTIIENLYQTIAREIYRAKPEVDWVGAKYDFMNITRMSEATCTYFLKDGQTISVDAGYDAQSAFSNLRSEMAKLTPKKGAWYTATFTLSPDGKFNFDFDYDHLPTFDVIPSPDKWENEFKQYPRPELQTHIQDWIEKKVEHDVVAKRLRALQTQ